MAPEQTEEQLPEPMLVIDLNAVAKATNRDNLMAQQLTQAESQLQTQLQSIRAQLSEELKTRTEAIEADKSKKKNKQEKNEELQTIELESNQKLQAVINEARQKYQGFQAGLLNQFKQEVAEHAAKIAQERNAAMVRYVDNSVVWFDHSIDITDEVIARFRASSTDEQAEAEDKEKSE